MQVMGTRIRTLVILSGIAVAGVIAFQVSWLLNSYKVSKQQAELDLNTALEEVIVNYKQVKADSARTLIKQLIKSEKDFNYRTFEWSKDETHIAYRDADRSYITFPLKKSEVVTVVKNPHKYLIEQVNVLPIEELARLYSSLLGVKSYPDGSTQKRLYYQLVGIFDQLFADAALMNRLLDNSLLRKNMNLTAHIKSLPDISEVFKRQSTRETSKESIQNTDEGTLKEVEISEVTREKDLLSDRLEHLELQIGKLNTGGDSVYIAKPMLNDLNDILRGRIPVILLSASVSATYTLQKMLYSIIGTFLLLLFLSFCIGYMLYLIIRQKKLSEIKNDFISNMSHELKTPIATTLAAVQGMQYFDILKDEKKTVSYLATASAELQRLSTMVTKILNSAVFDSTEFLISPAVFDLKELIEEVISAQHLLGNGHVSITLNCTLTTKIFADRTHLQQAIANLIDNGIKYSGTPATIAVECGAVRGGVEISIRDNGPGIPKEYQKQIFDKFFRVPKPNDHTVKGYGLGLNYVKAIIEKHGGSITLKKSDNTGSLFTLFLPQ